MLMSYEEITNAYKYKKFPNAYCLLVDGLSNNDLDDNINAFDYVDDVEEQGE